MPRRDGKPKRRATKAEVGSRASQRRPESKLRDRRRALPERRRALRSTIRRLQEKEAAAERSASLAQQESRKLADAVAERAALLAREQSARQQAEKAARRKDEFLAILSHKLRSPLNAIMGWAHLLREGRLDADTAARALEIICRNAEIQSQLISDILDASLIMAGELTLDAQPVNMASTAKAVLDFVKAKAEAKQLLIVATLDSDAGPVIGDSRRLQQVVSNLVSNAIKFTPPGGEVHVRLKRVESHVELVVRDTGCGIAPEFLPHVFDPFRQAETSDGAGAGRGLGLAVARHFAELHGGMVEAASPGVGLGATFTLRLPILLEKSKLVEARRS